MLETWVMELQKANWSGRSATTVLCAASGWPGTLQDLRLWNMKTPVTPRMHARAWMEKCFVGHAYASNCPQVCPGSLAMVDLAAALLIRRIDATSVVIGVTMPMTVTASARGEAVVAAGPIPDPGPALGLGDEGTAHDLAVVAIVAMKEGTDHPLTPGAMAGLPLQPALSLGLLCEVVRDLAHGLRHVHVVGQRHIHVVGLRHVHVVGQRHVHVVGLRHIHVVGLHLDPDPGHALQVLRETAVPALALPARKRAPPLEQTDNR